MRASIIVRSKDEACRLRLTLASLSAQTEVAEVIVVNDGSRDHTEEVVAAAAREMPVVYIRHAKPEGRSAAANAGAKRASGAVLIFLDGDTLAAPDLVARHLDLHRSLPGVVARGETLHLRCTRFLADPDAGSPMPGEEARVRRLSSAELGRMRVTCGDILQDFPSIDARAQPGIYPGAGPRLLYELEMAALRDHPLCGVLWAAASGSNQSVSAEAFRSVGGFDRNLAINEHRELALRLCRSGLRMVPVLGARTYHMTHRSGWRDPLVDITWEARFYRSHPIPEVALLSVLWASLSNAAPFPRAARLTSLPQLETAAARCVGLKGPDDIRNAHFVATASMADVR
jgi:GT2 family glycosyltransferase